MKDLIFINYRSTDEPWAALYLERHLIGRFGPEAVFRDSRGIELGTHFPDRLEQALQHCRAFIAVIGQNWLGEGSDGSRLIDYPRDYVRREIATALRRDIHVIPVLVGNATLPSRRDLPGPIAELARRQYLHLHVRSAETDIGRLIDELTDVLGVATPAGGPTHPPAAVPGASVTVNEFHRRVDARHSVIGSVYHHR